MWIDWQMIGNGFSGLEVFDLFSVFTERLLLLFITRSYFFKIGRC
jgi:hypothetical protein